MNTPEKKALLAALRNPVLKKDLEFAPQAKSHSLVFFLNVCAASLIVGSIIGIYTTGGVQ